MKKKEFNRRFKVLTDELAKDGIEVHVDRDINPEQLSCEFYKNNESLGYIWFTKGNLKLDICESGSLKCWLGEEKSYDSRFAKDAFEKVMDIHTDKELTERNIDFSMNNWFEVYCGTEENMYEEPDPDVLYSLEEALDAAWVRRKFEKAAA